MLADTDAVAILKRARRRNTRVTDKGAILAAEVLDSCSHTCHENASVPPRHARIERALAELRSSPVESLGSSPITLLAGSGATVFSITDTLPSDMRALHGLASRIVRTRTAERVVAVDVSD